MPFASALSKKPKLQGAIDEIAGSVERTLKGRNPDVTFAFVSHHYASRFEELAESLKRRLNTKVLVGCTGETIVGGSLECDDDPAISVLSGVMPDSVITPFHLSFEETPDGILCAGLPEEISDGRSKMSAVFLFGDPYSSVPASAIDLFADELPGVPLIGGMASGGGPGENRLFLQDQLVEFGAVGVAIQGGPTITTVVSQGCRPIGTPYVVTRAERNIIYELGGISPLERLQMLYPELPPRDQALVETGIHLGVAMNEYQESFQRGDFLIVNVHGADRSTGALATGGLMRVGQTVQFHIRDAETADEDLRQLLDMQRAPSRTSRRAALLFSCNGRGLRMFPDPNHDAVAIQECVGPLPLAGFFAQGELGPVSGKNYIHGFTASIALFEDTP